MVGPFSICAWVNRVVPDSPDTVTPYDDSPAGTLTVKPNVRVNTGPCGASPFNWVKPITFPLGSVTVTWSPSWRGEGFAGGSSVTRTVPWTVMSWGVPEPQEVRAREAARRRAASGACLRVAVVTGGPF